MEEGELAQEAVEARLLGLPVDLGAEAEEDCATRRDLQQDARRRSRRRCERGDDAQSGSLLTSGS